MITYCSYYDYKTIFSFVQNRLLLYDHFLFIAIINNNSPLFLNLINVKTSTFTNSLPLLLSQNNLYFDKIEKLYYCFMTDKNTFITPFRIQKWNRLVVGSIQNITNTTDGKTQFHWPLGMFKYLLRE